MADGYIFNREAVDRISKAVKAYENPPRNLTGVPNDPTAGGDVWLVVKITSAISGQGGRYNGRIWATAANPSTSGNLAASDLSTRPDADPGVDNCVVWNFAELGTPNHAIYPSSTVVFIIGKRAGIDNNGKVIVECFIASGVAPGTAQYQVYQMLTNTTAGWDYVRCHG